MLGFRQPKPSQMNTAAMSLIRLGDDARHRKDWHAAARYYADALAKDPALVHIGVQQGHALKELGDYDGAALAYSAALQHLGHDDDLHLQIGHLEKLKNNLPQAMVHYQRAIELNPSNHNARSELEALRYRLSQNQISPVNVQNRRPAMEAESGLPLLAISITGGVGDYIVIARYIRDLQCATEPFKFDIFCNYQKSAHWVFSRIPGYRGCYSEFLFDHLMVEYSLALRVNQYVVVHQEAANWLFLRKFPRLVQVIQEIARFRPNIEIFIENHPFMDGFLAQKAVYMNCTRTNFLHGISGIPYTGDRFDLEMDNSALRKFGITPGTYITVHNGFDPGVVISTRSATKCYPFYGEVIGRLKEAFPDLLVYQVGGANSLPIEGVDLDLVGETTLAEVAAIIGNSRLHLDNESGLVHLATALGIECCVIFGPTSIEYFGYAANINLTPKFCGGCWWITDTWMDQCPRGFAQARCMTEHSPSSVASTVERALQAQRSPAQRRVEGIMLEEPSRQDAD